MRSLTLALLFAPLLVACQDHQGPAPVPLAQWDPLAPPPAPNPVPVSPAHGKPRAQLLPDLTAIAPDDKCDIATLPRNLRWVGVAGYGSSGGGNSLGFALPGDTHMALGATIRVAEKGAIGLVLAAYEPHVWTISLAPGARVDAVVVMGYHRQRVTGLAPGTPVTYGTYAGKSKCATAYDAQSASTALHSMVGVRPERVEPLASEVTLGGLPGPFKSSGSVAVESFADKSHLPPGPQGVGVAVAKGLLRAATAEEMRHARRYVSTDMPAVLSSTGYVVLRPMALPAGLAGGNGAGTFFIVPQGVERPRGDIAHAVVVDLNTHECISALCR